MGAKVEKLTLKTVMTIAAKAREEAEKCMAAG